MGNFYTFLTFLRQQYLWHLKSVSNRFIFSLSLTVSLWKVPRYAPQSFLAYGNSTKRERGLSLRKKLLWNEMNFMNVFFAYGKGCAMGCMIKRSYIKMTFNSMSQIVIVELLGWAICIKRFLKKPLPPFGQRLRLRLRRHISSSLFSHGTNKREWWFLKRCKDCKHCPASLPFAGSL